MRSMTRQLKTSVSLIILGSLALVSACSDDGSGTPTAKVTATNVCTEIARVLCHNLFSCCTGAQIEQLLGDEISTDQKGCLRDMALKCESAYFRQLDAMERDTVELDTQRATDCLNALVAERDHCFNDEVEKPWTQACNESSMFTGKLDAGADCYGDYECKPDSFCAPSRKCVKLPVADEECEQGRCAEGLYCADPDSSSEDYVRRCKALAQKDEACGDEAGVCAEGLYCDTDADEPTCEALKKAGETCDANAHCETGSCTPGTCASSGESCYRDDQCQGVCEGTDDTCWGDSSCMGRCSESGGECYTEYSCDGENETCDPVSCIQVCEGERVCVEQLQKVDFCSEPIGLIFD